MHKTLPFRRITFVLILLAFFTAGCAAQKAASTPQTLTKEQPQAYKGTISGISEKAKTIAIQVGPEAKAETMMLRFDAKTVGIESAKKGDSVTIAYEMRGQESFALTVKPNLAKLPEGVSEIKTAELQALLDKGADLLLIDARPESRFTQSHLPTAVSISVEKLAKKNAAVLPKNKEQLLVFYCGGPT